MLGKRSYKNPIAQLDSNLKLAKYDKVRSLRMQKVLSSNQKLERSGFNMERTAHFNMLDLHYFEKCKEERLCKDRAGDSFINLVANETPLDIEMLSNRGFFIDFLAYLVAMQIRQVLWLTLDRLLNWQFEKETKVL